MKPYINCYRVLDLSPWDLETIVRLGFQGIRFDVKNVDDVKPSCTTLLQHGLAGILLINGGGMELTEQETVDLAWAVAGEAHGDVAIEVGNEPDISPRYKGDHDGFGRMVNRAATEAIQSRTIVISGGIFSTSADGLRYLAEALEWIDPTVHVGVHSYRQSTYPNNANRPFLSRNEEWRAIRTVAGHRPVWCTETGWHTAPFKHGLFGWRKKSWTDLEVRDFLAVELDIQNNGGMGLGAEACVIYQWTDGPSQEGIDRFGLKHFNQNALKSQAACVKVWGG